MLQLFFTTILVSVLAAACVFFAVMGMIQSRRTRRLRREARELGLRFSVDDPFDVPRRYASFALMGCGHSARAGNVTYGRLGARLVRAFRFRYEVGHGTGRITRRYNVVVVEADRCPARLLMWNDRDNSAAPLQARAPDGHLDCWSYRGDSQLASGLIEVRGDSDGRKTESYEVNETGLMVFAPADRWAQGYSDAIAGAAEAADAIDRLMSVQSD